MMRGILYSLDENGKAYKYQLVIRHLNISSKPPYIHKVGYLPWGKPEVTMLLDAIVTIGEFIDLKEEEVVDAEFLKQEPKLLDKTKMLEGGTDGREG